MQAAVEKLREFRDENGRSYDEVIQIWKETLSTRNLSSLGDEKWLILEQVFKAALHRSQEPLALECLGKLTKEFSPNSRRVSVLKAMHHESIGQYDAAEEIYTQLLKDNETDAIVHKRKISLFKEQNKIREAINELNLYLEVYQVDQEAWSELCDLYLHEHDYVKAAFCAEELILVNPHNHLNHERYASICYTKEDYPMARSYYFNTLKLNPRNMRALYGVLLTSIVKKSSPNTEDSNKLIMEKILAMYKDANPELLPVVENVLKSLM